MAQLSKHVPKHGIDDPELNSDNSRADMRAAGLRQRHRPVAAYLRTMYMWMTEDGREP
jgi:hypothetical protein